MIKQLTSEPQIKQAETSGLSQVLYHITGSWSAASIAKGNRIELKPAEGTDAETELQGKNVYYFSTSRTLSGAYIQNNLGSGVILVLDGRKLGSTLKGMPVDYWGDSYYQIMGVGEGGTINNGRAKRFESEDRVVSAKPWIDKASNYVTAVHCIKPRDRSRDLHYADIRRWCLINKIPLFFYPDARSLGLLDKRKAEPYVPEPKAAEKHEPSPEYRRSAFKRARTGTLHGWVALSEMPVTPADKDRRWDLVKRLGPDAEYVYKRLPYSDVLQGLKADLHNAKSTPYNDLSKNREALDKLIKLIAKAGTIGKFIAQLQAKWTSR